MKTRDREDERLECGSTMAGIIVVVLSGTRILSRRTGAPLLLAACVSLPAPAAAQLAVEARSGVVVGSHSTTLAGLELLPGPAVDLTARWTASDRYAFVAGGSFAAFGCEDAFCRGPLTVDVQHYAVLAGVEARYWLWWLRTTGGVGMTRIRGEAYVGPAFAANGGVRFDLWRFALRPGVSCHFAIASGERTLTMGLDFGIAYRVWGATR